MGSSQNRGIPLLWPQIEENPLKKGYLDFRKVWPYSLVLDDTGTEGPEGTTWTSFVLKSWQCALAYFRV